ncbi:FMN-binding protein [Acidipila rosea]|uniref:FMN-binding protein n=1 Tax=Acidipila rosea TaxID=768535 RepID=A0A4R1KYY6_9BACT|nr:FMN-binding protein [Acidipila rosea]TCK70746.1 FMN-binding protein [Acidipila rosea]
MKSTFFLLPLAAIAIQGGAAYAATYLSVEQAQALMFPGASFQPDFKTLSEAQVKAIQHASGVDVRNREVKAWRVSTGGWFLVDEVVGKHEYIPFALALDDKGRVRSVEILEYREAYGGQIREPAWRAQFQGKDSGTRLQLGRNIRNISGATLSCKHITDGVQRLLVTYEIALKQNDR